MQRSLLEVGGSALSGRLQTQQRHLPKRGQPWGEPTSESSASAHPNPRKPFTDMGEHGPTKLRVEFYLALLSGFQIWSL